MPTALRPRRVAALRFGGAAAACAVLAGAALIWSGGTAEGCGQQCSETSSERIEARVEPDPGREGAAVLVSDDTLPGPAASLLPREGTNRLGSERVPVRVYEPDEPAWATLVWAHGGSFVHGSLDMPESDWVSRRFAAEGVRVYAVDYALASDEVKAPAPANDLAAVVRAVVEEEPGPVAVGGASAGGNLAAHAALMQAEWAEAHGGRSVDAVLLEYPTLHREQRNDAGIAELTSALPESNQFGPERIADMYAYYLGEQAAGAGVRPVAAAEGGPETAGYSVTPTVVGELPSERLRLMPPTVIVNAEADDLRASGEQFAEQLRAAGATASAIFEPGTLHGYLNRPGASTAHLRAAERTVDRFVAELRAP